MRNQKLTLSRKKPVVGEMSVLFWQSLCFPVAGRPSERNCHYPGGLHRPAHPTPSYSAPRFSDAQTGEPAHPFGRREAGRQLPLGVGCVNVWDGGAGVGRMGRYGTRMAVEALEYSDLGSNPASLKPHDPQSPHR